MKKFARILSVALALSLCFMLSACSLKYVSKYSAAGMIKTNTSSKAEVSFNSLKGTLVFKLKNKKDGNAVVSYKASLDEGALKVSYDFADEKLELFSLSAGNKLDGSSSEIAPGSVIYIIIECEITCDGGILEFNLE